MPTLQGYSWNPQMVKFRYTAEFPLIPTSMRSAKQIHPNLGNYEVYSISVLVFYSHFFTLCAMRHALSIRNPQSKIRNRTFPTSAFRLPNSKIPTSAFQLPHSIHSCVCSRKNTTGFLRRIAIDGNNPIVTTSNTVARTSKMLSNING